ncbi:MAG: hypothetical protein IJS95_04135 [Prevotella sp.]|nr:hypothetical protein [Prevotella sp.]
MKKTIYFLLVGCLTLFTSCLKSGLDDIEDSDLCQLSTITMEYRWITQNANGYDQMSRQPMTLSSNTPDANNEIHVTVTVPPMSNTFPRDIRKGVTLDGLYLTSTISASAKIKPVGNAPELGKPGHFEVGETYQYVVTAANGNTATYSIIIDDFVNFESGTFSKALVGLDVVYFTGAANVCDYASTDGSGAALGEMGTAKATGYTGSAQANSCAIWDSEAGDMVIFKVTLEDNASYVFSCTTATKNDGVSINVEAGTDLEWLKNAANINAEHTYAVENTGSWGKFAGMEKGGYVISPTAATTYYIRILLQNEAGTGGTCCVKLPTWKN